MVKKRVLVGIPTSGHVHVNFCMSLASLVMSTKTTIHIQVATGSSICQNRNTLVRAAKREGVEFLLFIDDDLSFPGFAVDRMLHVMEENKIDILGCNYLFKSPPHQWMAMAKEGLETLKALDEVERLPCGMLMIRMSVFDQLEQPYFNYDAYPSAEGGDVGSEDYYFCDRAKAKGFAIWMDADLSFGLVHWGSPIGVRWVPQDPGYEYLLEPLKYGAPEPDQSSPPDR